MHKTYTFTNTKKINSNLNKTMYMVYITRGYRILLHFILFSDIEL